MNNEHLVDYLRIMFFGCKKKLINDPKGLERVMKETSDKIGSKLISSVSHRFNPQGVTSLGILESSHIAVHTWPERDFILMDISSCRTIQNEARLAKEIAGVLGSERFEFKKESVFI